MDIIFSLLMTILGLFVFGINGGKVLSFFCGFLLFLLGLKGAILAFARKDIGPMSKTTLMAWWGGIAYGPFIFKADNVEQITYAVMVIIILVGHLGIKRHEKRCEEQKKNKFVPIIPDLN